MRKFAILIPLAFAALSAGCSKTANVNDGSGFEVLRPLPVTRQFIVANDVDFARSVASHNATCASQPGCRK